MTDPRPGRDSPDEPAETELAPPEETSLYPPARPRPEDSPTQGPIPGSPAPEVAGPGHPSRPPEGPGPDPAPSAGPPEPRHDIGPIPEEIRYLEGPPAPAPRAPASPHPRSPIAPPRPHAPPRLEPREPSPTLEIQFPLPNAMVGKPYDATVPLIVRKGLPRDVRPEDLKVISRQIEGLQPLGLKAEPDGDRVRVHGEPRQAGDHPVSIAFTILIRGREWTTSTERFTFTINPDPRSLWKEIEPDASLPFVRPHAEKDRKAGRPVLLAASRRGRSHANTGACRDDAFELDQRADSGWSIVAVADGAGSARLSRRGAEIACRAASEGILPHLTTTLGEAFAGHLASYARGRGEEDRVPIRNALYKSLGDVGHRAHRRILAEAEAMGRPPEEFATTLIFTIAREFDFGWFAAAIAVGDGAVGIYRKESGITLLSKPDSGDYAGQTRFLTMPRIWADSSDILSRIHFEVVPDLTAIVAMTDGVTDPKFPSERALGDASAWHGFWADLASGVGLTRENPEADGQLLEWLNFWSVGNHDDRTIAILLP